MARVVQDKSVKVHLVPLPKVVLAVKGSRMAFLVCSQSNYWRYVRPSDFALHAIQLSGHIWAACTSHAGGPAQ